MIPYPIAELYDRLSIMIVAKEMTGVDNPDIDLYLAEARSAVHNPNALFALSNLVSVNGSIWAMESAIRQGKEEILGLEEVGRRALRIRDLNRERVKIKNLIAAMAGETQITKVDHASA